MSRDSGNDGRHATEQQRSDSFARSVLECAYDAMVLVDDTGTVQLANRAAERLFGYGRDELTGHSVEVLVPERFRARHPVHRDGFFALAHVRLMGAGLPLWGVRKDEVEFPLDISISPVRTDAGLFAIATIRDITARRRFEEDMSDVSGGELEGEHLRAVGAELAQALAEHEATRRELAVAQREMAESLGLLETLQATAPVGFGFVDRDFRVRRMNPTLAAINGKSVEELIGLRVSEMVPELWSQLEPIYRGVLESGEPVVNVPLEGEVTSMPGELRHWLASYYPVRVDEQVIGIGLVVVDVTDSQEAAELRAVVMDTMAEGMYVTDEDGRLVLMNAAASKLTGWSEDELRGEYVHDAIHYQHADGSAFPREECPLTAVRAGGEPTRVADDVFTHKDGSPIPVAYSSAALRSGTAVRGAVVVFRDTTAEKAEQASARRELNALSWVGRIRDALDDDRFVLYSQPIVPLTSAATPSKELLLRMIGSKGEVIPPGQFMSVAEKYGQIREIDEWVIARAISLAAEGHHLHANLSADSISNVELIPLIQRKLTETGADPGNIVFEITETALMGDVDAGTTFAHQVTEIGCALALDDFGTGYGSFTYLKMLPITYLKIDIEFVRDLLTSTANQHLVQAIVNIAQGFGLTTVAEGVEDAETLNLLREYGVDLAQGFYLGRPESFAPSATSTRTGGPDASAAPSDERSRALPPRRSPPMGRPGVHA